LGTVLPGSTRRWVLGPKPTIIDRAQFQRIARQAGEDGKAQIASAR
jgi:hypothetical protein